MKTGLRAVVIILVVLAILFGIVIFWSAVPALVKVLLAIIGLFATLYGGLTAWAFIPTRKFEPVVYNPIQPDYWPTDGFRTSTPEAQGMDSAKLLEIFDFYEAAHAKDPGVTIDSIAIIRNGYLVADIYFNPLFPRDSAHVIHSCTKSIMSALIGIAVEQGYIESVYVPIIEFFKEKQQAIRDPKMAQITLEDLLSMKTGIRSRDSFLYQWKGIFEMQATEDWVAHILSLPVDAEPGVRFDYSNLSSFMLSAIIHKATGMDTLTYARQNLFDPLGIREVRWERSPQNIYIGYARMWLKPQDMAKLGLLYLQQGQWNGEQIVPAAWVKNSVTPHAFPKNYVELLDAEGKFDQATTRRNWASANFVRAFADGYGYQWWLDKSGSYAAVGVAGQYIMVSPAHNLVVAVTSSASGAGVFFPKKILEKYILPAVKSNSVLPANPPAQQALSEKSGPPPLKQTPQAVPPLPTVALQISGKTYALEKNNWNYDNFRLVFDEASDQAEFSYTARVEDTAVFKVGLDGVYRFTETKIGCMAAMGKWTAADMFELTCHQIGYTAPAQFILTFKQDEIDVTEVGQTGSFTYSGKMQQLNTEGSLRKHSTLS
ncbi:serine hydrolase domain-containing protein [Candidatus Leptofilum sp.]|uniref:serine hydrolase domain-containing protein n=1 Tax=Candidatus Leptofilum sp. TaxID=3241576 RepID=UPI003B5952D6